MEQHLIDYFGQLQQIVGNYDKDLTFYSIYRRDTYTFRASTQFMSKAWRDWAIIDWGEDEGYLPCHFMAFVDLSALPPDFSAIFGVSGELYAGTFAIVEVAQPVPADELEVKSELFEFYDKEVDGFTGRFVSHNKYYLADVEAIVGPAAVFPDIGGPVNRYIYLKDRVKWKKIFTRWLEAPSKDDEVYSSEEESDAGDRANYEESSLSSEEETYLSEEEMSTSSGSEDT